MRRLWSTRTDTVRLFDDAVLRAPVRDVTDFGASLRALIDRLLRVQRRERAVGVAATQIGESWNVFVLNGAELRRGGKPEVYINPRILREEGQDTDEEGCLSFPGLFIPVVRPQRVEIEALDADGRRFTREGAGLRARAFSHETDHLLGRLIVDRVDPELRESVLARMRALRRKQV